MSDEKHPAADAQQLEEEIERLQAENARLAAAAEPDARRVRMARNGFAKAFIIIGALLIGFSIPAVWLNRTVMDTDRWVDTLGPLADDPAIQTLVSDAASDAILERVDVESYLRDLLPDQLDPLAASIGASVEGFIRTQTDTIVRSDQFSDVWTEVLRRSHPVVINALTGDTEGTISNQAGVISLDVGALSDAVTSTLAERGVPLVDNIPTGAIDRQVVLYESSALASASSGIALMNHLAVWIPWVGLLTLAGALALAEDRRKAVLWLGVALVVVTLLPLEAIYFGQSAIASAALSLGRIQSAAAESAYQIIFADLIQATRLFAFVGVALWAAAIIAGPSRWATALRSEFGNSLSGAAGSWELGAFGEFVSSHKMELRTAGFIVTALVFLAVPVRSLSLLLWLVVFLVAWLAVIEILGGARPKERAADAP